VDLLAISDPVFVVDLSPQTMRACSADFTRQPPGEARAGRAKPHLPSPPKKAIRAVALIFGWEDDPILLNIRPTKDTQMLDAMARLIRAAVLTRRSVASIVVEHGDDTLKRLYFSKGLPRFIYEGIPAPARHRIPREFLRTLGKRSARASQGRPRPSRAP
jgi:hypothetical protein